MEVGLYGKLPTHGDFLRRRVADDFVNGWDEWLQRCIAESRASLGEAWLDTYLTSPVWRFALAPAVCGAAAVAGILVPSVDRVGRYFPLTIVWPTPAHLSTLEIAVRFRAGFEHAERLLLDTLALEHFEFADFDRSVLELATYLENAPVEDPLRLTRVSVASVSSSRARAQRVPLRAASDLETPALQLYGQLLDSGGGFACWWTDGSSVVEPSWLMTRGLPDGSQYSAMLDGAWSAAGWQVVETDHHGEDPLATTAPPEPLADALVIASGAYSDRGAVRTTNQDAYIDRPDLRLWAVADGMGGLRDGDIASRMVCDSLANTPIAARLDEQIEGVIGQLTQVNAYLRRSATREVNPIHSGSTVVVLVIRDQQCAAVWAGDSRIYRLRGSSLSQLTTDHSWNGSGEANANVGDEQAITRAVGGEDSFSADSVRSDILPGDRFLLCSDGLSRSLDNALLTQLLQEREAAACCKELVSQAIARGSTDNVTALVVDCGATHAPALTEALNIVSL
jgi:type VI secretion system protein ImpM